MNNINSLLRLCVGTNVIYVSNSKRHILEAEDICMIFNYHCENMTLICGRAGTNYVQWRNTHYIYLLMWDGDPPVCM